MKINLAPWLLFFAILASACLKQDPSNAKARRIWLQHAKVVEALANGEKVDMDALHESANFFYTFGIVVPGSHSSLIDFYPTPETAKTVEPLRRWYQANGDLLYWDEKSERVLLRQKKSG